MAVYNKGIEVDEGDGSSVLFFEKGSLDPAIPYLHLLCYALYEGDWRHVEIHWLCAEEEKCVRKVISKLDCAKENYIYGAELLCLWEADTARNIQTMEVLCLRLAETTVCVEDGPQRIA